MPQEVVQNNPNSYPNTILPNPISNTSRININIHIPNASSRGDESLNLPIGLYDYIEKNNLKLNIHIYSLQNTRINNYQIVKSTYPEQAIASFYVLSNSKDFIQERNQYLNEFIYNPSAMRKLAYLYFMENNQKIYYPIFEKINPKLYNLIKEANKYGIDFRITDFNNERFIVNFFNSNAIQINPKNKILPIASDIRFESPRFTDHQERDKSIEFGLKHFLDKDETYLHRKDLLTKTETLSKQKNISQLVKDSINIKKEELEKGEEIFYSNAIIQALASSSDKSKLVPIKNSLLHLLQKVEKTFPGYLEKLQNESHSKFIEFNKALAENLLKERESLLNKVILDKNTHLVVLLPSDSEFFQGDYLSLANTIGIPKNRYSFFHGGRTYNGKDAKEAFLDKCIEISSNSNEKCFAMHHAHGYPTNNNYVLIKSPDNNDQNDKNIFLSNNDYLEKWKNLSTQNPNFICCFDSCHSYMFQDYLNDKIKDPTNTPNLIITTAPKGSITYRYPAQMSFRQNDQNNSYYISTFLNEIILKSKTTQEIKIKDVYDIDSNFNLNREECLKTWNFYDFRPSENAKITLPFTDIGIFNNKEFDLKKLIEETSKKIDLPLPESPADQKTKKIFLEVSDAKQPALSKVSA